MNKRKSYLDELKHNALEQNRWQFCIQSLYLILHPQSSQYNKPVNGLTILDLVILPRATDA